MASIENISVHVRVRPLNDAERDKGKAWKVDSNSIAQTDPLTGAPYSDAAPYTLDTIFDGQCTTAQVYQRTTRDLIHQVVEGFNSTVFAYGQTSSGKTHTMRGTDTEPGIIPLAVQEIFDLISATKDREFLLRVSYMELYNEDINDLLAPENCKLPVHESKESGIYVAGLREDIVSGPEQVLDLLADGERHRHVGETKMNKNSSRSHTIFRMVIESRSTCSVAEGTDVGAIRVSALTLVDLAGSERIAKTGAEGQRAKEGAAINKSLLTLGTVINKLSEGVAAAGGHIPYRDSKLTRILQPSLGGNAKTAIICAITPAAQHVEESHSTLRFACRAKRVVNNATVNEVLSDAAVLKRQAREIEELRNALESSGNAAQIEAEINRLRAELLRKDQEKEHMSVALAAEKEERERAQRKVESMTRLMLEGGNAVGARAGSPQGRGSLGGAKKKRDNRRETWCPGAGQRKRPLLPNLAALAEGEEGVPASDAAVAPAAQSHPSAAQRRSDGGALLSWASGSSPPRKVQCTQNLSEDGSGSDTSALMSRIRELETANGLMQRELDALAETTQRTQQQLQNAEDELVAVADERDKLGPALKEAQWKARQLEREMAEVAAERDAAAAAVAELEAAVEAARNSDSTDGEEVKQQLDAAVEEACRLRSELEVAEKAKVELAEALAEKERLNVKVQKAKAAATEAEEKTKALANEITESRAAKEAAEERLEEVENRARHLYEETERLSAHISDLESRKRAPLYQKRQEDELRAAVEKAAEAEFRATDAELKAKEAKTAAEAAAGEVAQLKEELERAQATAAEELADLRAEAEVAAQRSVAEAELVAAKHAEALAAAQAREDALTSAKTAAEATLAERVAELEVLNAELAAEREAKVSLAAQLEETQACADAAAQHVQFLEEKAETEATEAEKEKKELEQQIESVRAEMVAASEAHTAALTTIAEEREALAAVNSALESAKAELEAKVATAAGALNALEELKELKRKYKEETTRLNQALKAASAGSKGTEKAVDRAAKETDRLRSQIKDLEGKLRAAVADKNSAQIEKAALDRELRGARAQLDKLNKNMSRITGVEERKRESVMAGFNQAKSRVSQLEDALAIAQTDLEKTSFELEAKRAEVETLSAHLEEVQRAGEESAARAEDLAAHLEASEGDGEALRAELDAVRAELGEKTEEAAAAVEKIADLESQLTEAHEIEAALEQDKAAIEADLAAVRGEATATAELLTAAEAKLPRIAELQTELQAMRKELQDAQMMATENEQAAQVRISALEADVALLESKMEEIAGAAGQDKAAADAAVAEAQEKIATLDTTIEERAIYISSLENQINDAMAEGMELKAAVDGASVQCQALEQQLAAAHAAAEAARENSDKISADLSETQRAMAAVQEELQSVKAELEAAKVGAAEVATEAEGLRTQLTASAENSSALEARVASLEADLQGLNSQRETLELQLSSAREECAKWQSIAEEQMNAHAGVDAAFSEKVMALQATQAALADLEAKVAAAEAATAAVVERETEVRDELESRLASLETDLQSVNVQRQEIEADLGAAREEAAKWHSIAAEQMNAQAGADAVVAEKSAALQQALEVISQLEGKVSASEAMEDQLSTLESDLQALTAHRDALASELNVVREEAAQWRSVAEERGNAQAGAEAMNAEKSVALQRAQAAVSELENKVAMAEAAAMEAMRRETEVRATLEAQLAAARSELEGAMNGYSSTDSALAQERAKAASLAATVQSLREELEVERAAVHAQQDLAAQQVAATEAEAQQAAVLAVEESDRKIAALNSRIQSLECQVHRATAEVEAAQQKAVFAAGPDGEALATLERRCTELENDLRKSKRREEKLQALQYRLREDLKHSGGDVAAFDQLRDVRAVEYELDRLANRASREKAALKEALAAAQKRVAELEAKKSSSAVGAKKALVPAAAVALADKENIHV